MTEPADDGVRYTAEGLRIIGTTPEGWRYREFARCMYGMKMKGMIP